MFFKKKKTLESEQSTAYIPPPRVQYNEVISKVTSLLSSPCDGAENISNEHKIALLDYVLETIKLAIRSDLLNNMLLGNSNNIIDKYRNLFPIFHRENIDSDDEFPRNLVYIDLHKTTVLSIPAQNHKIISSTQHIFNDGFKCYKVKTDAVYYDYLNICHAHESHHHFSVGSMQKSPAFAYVENINVIKMFSNMYTDGAKWYCTYDNTKTADVTDYRLAVIFTLAKRKYDLEQVVKHKLFSQGDYTISYKPSDYQNWKVNSYTLAYVPKQEITFNMCYEVINCKETYDSRVDDMPILHYIPSRYKTYDLCLTAVKHDAYNISKVPPEMIDFKMAVCALSQDEELIFFIPKHLICNRLHEAITKTKGQSKMINTTSTYNYILDEWDVNSPVFKALNMTTEDIDEVLKQSALCKIPFEFMLGVILCGNNGVTVLTNNENKTITLPAQIHQTDNELFEDIKFDFYK